MVVRVKMVRRQDLEAAWQVTVLAETLHGHDMLLLQPVQHWGDQQLGVALLEIPRCKLAFREQDLYINIRTYSMIENYNKIMTCLRHPPSDFTKSVLPDSRLEI